jgi:hypothetical protein
MSQPRFVYSDYNLNNPVDPNLNISSLEVKDIVGNKLTLGDEVAIVMQDRSNCLNFRKILGIKYYHPEVTDTALAWDDPNRTRVDYSVNRIFSVLEFERKVTRRSKEVMKVVREP